MSLKKLKLLEMQILKTLIFPRAVKKLQNWVNVSFLFYLKVFSVFIVNGSAIVSNKHGKIKKWKRCAKLVVCSLVHVLTHMLENEVYC